MNDIYLGGNEDKKTDEIIHKKNNSYTKEDIEKYINNTINETQLLPLYLDKIRNGYIFTEDMLKKIEKFDDYSKMKIII